jgi:hypothetical protein
VVGAAVLAAPTAAYAAGAGTGTVGPPIVAPGGTGSINDPSATFTTTTPTVQLSVASCNGTKVTLRHERPERCEPGDVQRLPL